MSPYRADRMKDRQLVNYADPLNDDSVIVKNLSTPKNLTRAQPSIATDLDRADQRTEKSIRTQNSFSPGKLSMKNGAPIFPGEDPRQSIEYEQFQ